MKVLSYDPDTAVLTYALRHDPGDFDRAGGTYGTLHVDGQKAMETWEVRADEETFELDPCSCGCPGCGYFEARASRAGPYLVWTAWDHRREEAADVEHLPLVFSRQAIESALGGDTAALPELGADQAWRLLTPGERWPFIEARPLEGGPWRWAAGGARDEPALDLARRLHGLSVSDLEGASLHRAAEPAAVLTDGALAIDIARIDGALGLRCGPLRRFGLFLRIPRLR
jgi:hypothetical protein